MIGNGSRDTTPELALRSALHRLGLRFRVDARPVASIPRRADVVLRGDRVAVFLDGCFWHGCPVHFRSPSANAAYWAAKIGGNRARDASTTTLLEAAGWHVVRVWEHEPARDAARRIAATLVLRRAGNVNGPVRSAR
jgi:DNA mismatch endonuclease (patch repair protein)